MEAFDVRGAACWKYAPEAWRGELQQLKASGESVEAIDVRTAAELQAAGFAVQQVGTDAQGEHPDEEGEDVYNEVSVDVFCKWLEVRELRLGEALSCW